MSQKIDLKVEYTNKMAQENEALRAQVEQLRVACQLGIDMFIANDINVPNTIETMQDAIDATPAQCLAEIKAQAGRDGFIEGVRQMCENEIGWFGHDAESCANHYANRLRQQVKGE